MPSHLRAQVLGHAGSEPEQRYTQAGQIVATLSIAVDTGRRGPDGQWQEQTEWVRVNCFGKTAERLVERGQKGDLLLAEGSLKIDRWTGQDGTPRFTALLLADRVTVIGKRNSGDPTGNARELQTARSAGPMKQNEAPDDLDSMPF